MSTAIVSTIERISASLIKEDRLKICTDDTDAEQRLLEYLPAKGWPGDSLRKDVVPSKLEQTGPIQVAEGGVNKSDRKEKVQRLLEHAVEKTLSEEGTQLAEKVTKPQHDEFIAEPETVKIKPLEDMSMIDEDECLTDKLYDETKDEQMRLAIRIVYKALPLESRSSDMAKKLAWKIWNEHTKEKK